MSLEAQEGAIDDRDDLFKEMVDHGEEDSAVYQLEFDLNQLCEVLPDLASEILHAIGFVNFDRELATNKSRPLSIDKIVNEQFPQPVETVQDGSSNKDQAPDEPISPPSQNEAEEAIEIMKRLRLLTKDLDLDPLLLKVSNKTNQRRLDRFKQSSISDFFKKVVSTVF